MGCIDQSPPCQRGVPRLAEAGGFRRQSLRNFLPIPSSLFPKKPSPFHIGLYFEEVPTVNPSVKNQRFLPAPFDKGAFGVHRPKPPLRKGGASAPPRRGDSEAGRFPHRFVLLESSHCESLSQKSKIFASSLSQGSLGCSADTGRWRCSRCIDQSPPCQRGVPRHRRGGGIPQAKPAELLTYSLFTIP